MPAFFDPYFWSFSNAELWVGVGLVIFFAILFAVGAFKKVGQALDAKAADIQANLDEAARLRAEAEAMLAKLTAERAEAETQAKAMIEAAQAEAVQMEADAKAKLAESIARRQALAERKIAQAEAQALAEVKAAAAEAGVRAAEQVLASRLAEAGTDPLADRAIAQLTGRLN